MLRYAVLLFSGVLALMTSMTTPALAAQTPLCYYGAIQIYLSCVDRGASQIRVNLDASGHGNQGLGVSIGSGGTATATNTGPGFGTATHARSGQATSANTGPRSSRPDTHGTGTGALSQ